MKKMKTENNNGNYLILATSFTAHYEGKKCITFDNTDPQFDFRLQHFPQN